MTDFNYKQIFKSLPWKKGHYEWAENIEQAFKWYGYTTVDDSVLNKGNEVLREVLQELVFLNLISGAYDENHKMTTYHPVPQQPSDLVRWLTNV